MFWNNLVNLCNQHQTTPTSVVKSLGIAAGSVTKWKSGVLPRSTTLAKLANYFGVTVEDLLADEPPQIEKAPAFTFDERTENNVAKILALIADLPTADELQAFYASIGHPLSCTEYGLTADEIRFAFTAAKDIRDKYVLGRLLWDLGLLEETAGDLAL